MIDKNLSPWLWLLNLIMTLSSLPVLFSLPVSLQFVVVNRLSAKHIIQLAMLHPDWYRVFNCNGRRWWRRRIYPQCLDKACKLNEISEHYDLTSEDAQAQVNLALRWAARNGHFSVLRYVSEHYDLTAKDARANDNQALRWAAYYGHLSVVRYLSEHFCLTAEDARAVDNFALGWAAECGHLSVVRYLSEHFGLTAEDARSNRLKRALRWAADKGQLSVVRYLSQHFGLTV